MKKYCKNCVHFNNKCSYKIWVKENSYIDDITGFKETSGGYYYRPDIPKGSNKSKWYVDVDISPDLHEYYNANNDCEFYNKEMYEPIVEKIKKGISLEKLISVFSIVACIFCLIVAVMSKLV